MQGLKKEKEYLIKLSFLSHLNIFGKDFRALAILFN